MEGLAAQAPALAVVVAGKGAAPLLATAPLLPLPPLAPQHWQAVQPTLSMAE
jgi:hypothetical protein